MAEKLNVNTGGSHMGKKIWNAHQKNEYTKVDNYKEGLCFGCMRRTAVGATVLDICRDCLDKKPAECILAYVKPDFHGFCWFCKFYKFFLSYVNIRLCQTCMRRVREGHKELRQKGTNNTDLSLIHI